MTVYSFVNREKVLKKISVFLLSKNAEQSLVDVSLREKELTPALPPE